MNNTNSTLPIGTILNHKYHIQSHLSSGGFGNTYLAVYGACKTKVAIKEFFMRTANLREADGKTVSVDNSKEDAKLFHSQLEKFKKEAVRLQQISNAYVVKVYDLFEENGTAYYVMDFVEGYDLESRLKRRGKPYTEIFVSNFLYRILDALSAIHSKGLLHLDLKPSNIMVMPRGYIKLIDMGASKEYVAGKGATIFSGIAMTPAYAAPEQIDGTYEKLGPWTDFYSLGATLYRMLTNKVPPSFSDLYEDKSEDKHVVLYMPNVSEKMRGLVVWMMQLDRTKRPQKASDIIDFLNSKKCKQDTICITNVDDGKHFNRKEDTFVANSPVLSVGESTLYFTEIANCKCVHIDTNQKFVATCYTSWASVVQRAQSLMVYVTANNDESHRMCNITVKAGTLSENIIIYQRGKNLSKHEPFEKEISNTQLEKEEEFSFVGCLYIIIALSIIVYILKIIFL